MLLSNTQKTELSKEIDADKETFIGKSGKSGEGKRTQETLHMWLAVSGLWGWD